MKKRIFALLLAVTLVLSALAAPAAAEGFTVTVSETTATAGDSNITVDILLENNPGIAGFSFCVRFDERLVLTDAEILLEDGYTVNTLLEDGALHLAWTSAAGYAENGKLATLCFDVPKDFPAETAAVEVFYRTGYDSFYDASEADLAVQTVSGGIQVVALPQADTPILSIGNVDALREDVDVVVPVILENNPGFSGFSFCVSYDTDRLALTEVEIPLEGGYKVVGYPEGYGVNIGWTSTTPYTADGTIALLHFTPVENAPLGNAYVQAAFRAGYDSFYLYSDGTEQDFTITAYSGYVKLADQLIHVLLGDVNGSGDINMSDVITLIQQLTGRTVPGFVSQNADYNQNGSVDMTDVIAMMNNLIQ